MTIEGTSSFSPSLTAMQERAHYGACSNTSSYLFFSGAARRRPSRTCRHLPSRPGLTCVILRTVSRRTGADQCRISSRFR